MAQTSKIHIEVVYASAQQQWIVPLSVAAGTTVGEAIQQSGITTDCPEMDLNQQCVGIFSKKVSLQTVLHEGDRVEIYRPLTLDPKQRRRLRAKSKIIP